MLLWLLTVLHNWHTSVSRLQEVWNLPEAHLICTSWHPNLTIDMGTDGVLCPYLGLHICESLRMWTSHQKSWGAVEPIVQQRRPHRARHGNDVCQLLSLLIFVKRILCPSQSHRPKANQVLVLSWCQIKLVQAGVGSTSEVAEGSQSLRIQPVNLFRTSLLLHRYENHRSVT